MRIALWKRLRYGDSPPFRPLGCQLKPRDEPLLTLGTPLASPLTECCIDTIRAPPAHQLWPDPDFRPPSGRGMTKDGGPGTAVHTLGVGKVSGSTRRASRGRRRR